MQNLIVLLLILCTSLAFSKEAYEISLSNEVKTKIPKPVRDFERIPLKNTPSFQSKLNSASVALKSQGSAGQLTTVCIDGGLSAHTKIAIEGVEIDSAQISPMDIGILPIELAEGVDVYKNNGIISKLGGMAGLVDFRLGHSKLNRTKVDIYGGSFWNFGFGLSLSRYWGETSFSFKGGVSFASNDYTIVNPDRLTNIAENLDFLKASLVAKLSNRSWDLFLTHSMRFAGTGTKYAGIGRQEDHLSLVSFRAHFEAFRLDSSYTRWYNDYQNPHFATQDSHINQSLKIAGEYGDEIALGNLGISWEARLQNSLYWLESTKIPNPFDNQTDLTLNGNLSLTGLKLGFLWKNSLSTINGYNPFWGAEASYHIVEGWEIYGSLSSILRLPTFNDLYWANDGFSVGNSNLLPETGFGYKAGFIFLHPPFYLNVSYLENRLENLILWQSRQGVWSPENIGKALSRVFAIQANYEDFWFSEYHIRASVGFSINSAENNDPQSPYYGKRLLYIPLYKLTARFGASFMEEYGLDISWRAESERFTTEANTVWLHAYWILDAYLYYHFLYLSVENITDTRYESVEGYPLAGRQMRLGMKIEF